MAGPPEVTRGIVVVWTKRCGALCCAQPIDVVIRLHKVRVLERLGRRSGPRRRRQAAGLQWYPLPRRKVELGTPTASLRTSERWLERAGDSTTITYVLPATRVASGQAQLLGGQ